VPVIVRINTNSDRRSDNRWGIRTTVATSGPTTYSIGQFAGGIIGAGTIASILSGTDGYLSPAQDAGFASNGFGDHPPGGFGLLSVAITEIVVTTIFVLIVLGATSTKGVPTGFGPIATGLGLTLVHLISIPVSNTSVNPARSLAIAVFQGDWALGQVSRSDPCHIWVGFPGP